MIKFNEAHKRTIGKSVSWRIIITLVQIVNGLIVTGSLAFGIQMASLGAAVNIVLYWVHERVWNKIQWSREQAGSMFIYWSHERLWNIASFGKQVLDVDDTNDVLEK